MTILCSGGRGSAATGVLGRGRTAATNPLPAGLARSAAALALCVFCAAGPHPAHAKAAGQPDCPSLEAWAAKQVPGETVSLAPKVEISALLRDDLLVPLVGKPFASWGARDGNALKRALNTCRREANRRKDKRASDALYKAIQAVTASLAPLAQMQRARSGAPQQVRWLLAQHPSPYLAGQLALAQDALRGERIDPKRYGLTRRPDWASGLQHAADFLPAVEVEPLVARLGRRQAELEARAKAADGELAAAREDLANAPATPQGLATLDRLAKLPALEVVAPKDADAFRRAVQQKRWAIQRTLQPAQHPQPQPPRQVAAAGAKPVEIDRRLEEMLVGGDVGEVSLRGLRPGIAYDEARRMVQRDWHFGSGAGGDLMKEFAPTRRDMDRYTKTERRDGGWIEFQTMHGKVGQIKFAENYTAALNVGSAYAGLEKRFGKPEKRETDGAAVLARWKDGRSYLQVYVGNRVSGPRNTRVYRSSVVVQLWNRDYMDYLIEAQRRCEKLRHKPMSELSVADKQAMLAGCKSP